MLAKQTPQYRLLTLPVADASSAIQPGDPNYPGHAVATFDRAVELIYSQPDMHLRGKDMDVRLMYPTCESEMLVSVPHYDFNWQTIYFEAKPEQVQLQSFREPSVPNGTRIDLFAHWDNSVNNRVNPDPKATVRWGDQSWDEMIFAWVGVVVPRDTDPEKVMAKPVVTSRAAR